MTSPNQNAATVPWTRHEFGETFIAVERMTRKELLAYVRRLEAFTGEQLESPNDGVKPSYQAVSVNERGMEWKVPLWHAIQQWADSVPVSDERMNAVVAVEDAVVMAMRIAIEEYTSE